MGLSGPLILDCRISWKQWISSCWWSSPAFFWFQIIQSWRVLYRFESPWASLCPRAITFCVRGLASGRPRWASERLECQQTCFIMAPKTGPKKVLKTWLRFRDLDSSPAHMLPIFAKEPWCLELFGCCCRRLSQHGVGEVLIPLWHCWRDAFFCVCVGSESFCHDWASHCSVLFWSLDALFVFGLPPFRPPRLLTRQLCGSGGYVARSSVSSG